MYENILDWNQFHEARTGHKATPNDRDIIKLSQKGNTIEWLRRQPATTTFAPNSRSQCVYGRMFRQQFGSVHEFALFFDYVEWDWHNAEETKVTRLTPFAVSFQHAALNYMMERDGVDEDNNNGQITRAEAIKIAKGITA